MKILLDLLFLYHTYMLFAEKCCTSQIGSLKNAHEHMLNLRLLD